MFDGVLFHVEAGSQAGGRRVALHQFPKRDYPYAEDLGRRAIEFVVRGYVIQFMFDAGPVDSPHASLYMRDYRLSRDALQQRLDAGGDGVLQLPNSARGGPGPPLSISVVCTQYRMTEEQRFGGYCVFDMTFVEFGKPASVPKAATASLLTQAANGALDWITNHVSAGP
jgi:hypothetical protein